MRIKSINCSPDPEVGLGSIVMSDLGQVVIIAGRNGAGKTRLMKKIIKWAQGPQGIKSTSDVTIVTDPPITTERRVSARSSREQKPIIVPFVPSRLELSDPSSMTQSSIVQASGRVESPGIGYLPGGAFARIQHLQDRKRETAFPDSEIPEEEAAKAIEDFDRLEALIKRFLGTRITRSINREAQLFGLPLGKTALSDGQKVLLQLCVAIHAQSNNLHDLIIFMDVPENHLHPAALLDVVQAVQEHIDGGQLWIATHSIPLLAHVDPSSIWWMENSTISRAGSNPQTVLTGLLGAEERTEKLASFLDLPFSLASNRFAAECVLPPGVAAHAKGDPQSLQICSLLQKLRKSSGQLRVLDFGAGKGRLASELAEGWTAEEREGIDYIAFEVATTFSQECQKAICRLCGSSDDRLFHDASTLRAKYDEKSFHCIILCNVLHEISPENWGDYFGPEGKITNLLRDDGYLLLVEVQQLPYGERPHSKGFMVLDTAQLRKLFAITEADNDLIAVDSQRNGWLKAHIIGQPLIARFTTETRKNALNDLSSMARDEIRKIMGSEPSYRHGRLYGFWIHQFAHAELALRQL